MPDGAYLANPDRAVMSVLADVLAPPPPVDLNRWAVDNLTFGEESPFRGPYNPDRFPFFERVLEVLGPDHPAREVVFKKSAQLGGTVLAQVYLAGTMDMDPGPWLYVHPTEGNATRWARTKWRPMVRRSPTLNKMFGGAVTREGGNSILYQERRDGKGWLQIGGANSEASLSMISVARQVQDDLSKWEMNNAGDPESQADSRSKAFEWAKVFKISTPLIEDNCRISKAFSRSTQEHFHVPCPHCDHFHPLEWDVMRAQIEASGEAAFACPDCGGIIEERHKAAIVRQGHWVAHNPGAEAIGFYLWAAYSPLESWSAIASRFRSARGDPQREQTFENDDIGRAYKTDGESPPSDEIQRRAEHSGLPRGVVPRGGLLLVLAMDCQDDRVECHIKAFGRDLKRWTVDYLVVEGHIAEVETQKRLDAEINRLWPDFQGGRRAIDIAAIDGNAWTQDVFEWVKRHPQTKAIMVRGVSGDAAPPLAVVKKERTRDGRVRKYQRRFFNVGTSGIKLGLYKQLQKGDPLERGYCGYPAGLDADFFEQLTAERRKPVRKKSGFTEYQWVKSPDARNEVLDTEVYAEAAAVKLGWRSRSDPAWDDMEAEREAPPEAPQLDLEELMTSVSVSKPSDDTAKADRRERIRARARAAAQRYRH